MLPDLTPRDPHSLWYTSRHTHSSLLHQLNSHDASLPNDDNGNQGNNQPNRPGQHPSGHGRDHRRALVERTPLARLRMEEQVMERRRQNVTNFGSAWLKPPGVPKTLFQMREERREAEEHAEAMRREQELAAQLAEAEADAEGVEDLDDEQMADGAEEPDLDDEIPEAEGFGFDGDDSEEEESVVEDEEDDDETDEEVDENENNAGQVLVSPAEREMQATEDRVREVMAQGQDGGGLTIDDDDPVGSDDREQMLEEDDLIHNYGPGEDGAGEDGMDMDMDADLDDDIPSADGRYEHTDSEAEISDEDESTRDVSYASAGRAPQASRSRRSLPNSNVRGSQRGSLAQSDIDFSGLLSRDESSYLASSPQMRRRG
ncbi:hypothetical protein DHEL01_v206776 [Diaporthe helianthi]|uniref:Apc15p protein-domain-containing protein n=1 Tax=Diaporthe helianthi TaxID=158607 RepID=A0A2P5HX58_DIAHE|nr:hypothetical protein DHEL01_v206776 [Diaporthe helianthi]